MRVLFRSWTRQLSNCYLLIAFAVLDYFGFSIEPRHLGKSRNAIRAFRIDVGDLDEEIEPAVGIVAVACFGHGSRSLHAGRHSASPVFCETRKMTNSECFKGEKQTRRTEEWCGGNRYLDTDRARRTTSP